MTLLDLRDIRFAYPGHPPVLPVLSMYDQRRKLHRWVRENAAANWPVIPQSSHVEQVAVRREPIAAFANWSPASKGFEQLHAALESKLGQLGLAGPPQGGGQRALPRPENKPAEGRSHEESRVVPIRDAASARQSAPSAPLRAPSPAREGLARRAFSF